MSLRYPAMSFRKRTKSFFSDFCVGLSRCWWMVNVGECSDYISPGKSGISPGKYRCVKTHSALENDSGWNMLVSWIKITNSGTRAWLVQEYLSAFAKGRREDARRRERHAWHHADGRCSGLACDRSNVTVVHLSVVGGGGLQIQTRLNSFSEK